MSTKGPLVPLNKLKLFTEWMKGDHVLVHLDARRDDVIVPEHLKSHPALTLKLSYLFQGKTEHGAEGITSYLKFSGLYQECHIPWSALWGMTSGDGQQVVWPESAPPELLKSSFIQQAEKQAVDTPNESNAADQNAIKPGIPAPRHKPNLTPIHSLRPKEKAPSGDDEPPSPDSPDERRKGITRIK